MAPLVLDLTRLLPGPLAGRILAQMGFDVLRLLPPAGDMTAFLQPDLYEWLGSSKRTETIDLKREEGTRRLRELVPSAAVLLETNRPGVMEKLGVGPLELLTLNPALTYVRIAGFREEPWREAPGHDLTYLAAAGLLDRFSEQWGGYQFADASGGFWGALAAVEGMRQGGGFFEVYLSETAGSLAYPALPMLDGRLPCYAIYPAQEGQIALAALEPHLWEKFCKAVNRPEWLFKAFSEGSEAWNTMEELKTLFRSKSGAEWEALALAQGLPLRAVKTASDFPFHAPWRKHT
ncbi:MAG: CoA transferase [Blastocatellia bacterium]|nr:CoA transferase [Blastocatellia bacterium]